MAHNFNYDDYKISSKMDWKEVENQILKEEKRNLRIQQRIIQESRKYIFRHPDRENQDSLSAQAAKDRFLEIISDAAGGHDDTYIHHLDTHAPIDTTMLADAFEAMTDHANLFSNTLKKSLGSGRETSRWESVIKPQIEKIVQRFPKIYGEVEQFISAVEANKQESLSEGCAGGVCTIGGGSPSSSSSQYNGARIGSLRTKAPKVKRSSVVVMEDIDGVTREVVVTDVSEDIKEGRAGFKGFWLEDPSKITWGFNEDIKVVMGTLESLLEMEIKESSGGYENVVFMQGHDAEEALEILNTHGEEAAIEHLKQWHYPGEHEIVPEIGAGTQDTVHETDDGYILTYNNPLGYIGLYAPNTIEENFGMGGTGSAAGCGPGVPIARVKSPIGKISRRNK